MNLINPRGEKGEKSKGTGFRTSWREEAGGKPGG